MNRQLTATIKTAPLPATIHGVLQQSGNNYKIYINSDQTNDEQAAAFLHECLHIYHNDSCSPELADSIEHSRRAELLRILKLLSQEA